MSGLRPAADRLVPGEAGGRRAGRSGSSRSARRSSAGTGSDGRGSRCSGRFSAPRRSADSRRAAAPGAGALGAGRAVGAARFRSAAGSTGADAGGPASRDARGPRRPGAPPFARRGPDASAAPHAVCGTACPPCVGPPDSAASRGGRGGADGEHRAFGSDAIAPAGPGAGSWGRGPGAEFLAAGARGEAGRRSVSGGASASGSGLERGGAERRGIRGRGGGHRRSGGHSGLGRRAARQCTGDVG